MTGFRHIKGPIIVVGFNMATLYSFRSRFASIDAAYGSLGRTFCCHSDLLDRDRWRRSTMTVRDEFDRPIPVELMIEDFKAISKERDQAYHARSLERLGLTAKHGYRFRGGPIQGRNWPRQTWFSGDRRRHVGAGLREVFEPDDLEEASMMRKAHNRSRWVLELLGDLEDREFPSRRTERNWKRYRKTQWRDQKGG